jgi:cytochrome P450
METDPLVVKHVPAWLPGAGFQRFAAEARATMELAGSLPIEAVKAQMVCPCTYWQHTTADVARKANGTAPPSMVRSMLEDDATLPPEESQLELIKQAAGTAYIAGSDSTRAAIVTFILAMLTYPDVQAKAQAAVDRVVGADRLPEFEDLPAMPYIRGVANECLRWLPVVPLGPPCHARVATVLRLLQQRCHIVLHAMTSTEGT